MVGVNHHSSRVISHTEKTLQCEIAPLDICIFGTDQHIVGIGVLSDALYCVRTLKAVNGNEGATFRHRMLGSEVSVHQEVDMLYCFVFVKIYGRKSSFL